MRNTPGTNTPAFQTDFGRLGMMICADRKHRDLVGRIVAEGAEFLLCPSGGMFGPAKNDGFLQERSRENKVHIVFVHPCEFLVTGPDGAILSRTLLGDSLLVTPAQMDSEMDARNIFFFDLPIRAR